MGRHSMQEQGSRIEKKLPGAILAYPCTLSTCCNTIERSRIEDQSFL
jgi:hypothetical protein